ncbi:hypothetical protein [Anaerococcus degeneri]|uniref:Histidine kinase n=1 Tax=Anaerococcus degeneri TaxID=361500 RepID=A0ABS7YZ83_9FIRM|nr:hypothetical protein [Anaerococcus degeneri]MBP2016397.1 hypothetical protein [Anaerococcus degeneri]MCA2096755.1 hypothetical protein [Anaerococcus degeneri]
MENKFEIRMSKTLVFLIIVLFLLTFSQRFVSGWILSLSWYILFLVSWLGMLVYSFDVLLNKKARGFSIFLAIMTSIAFAFLSIHGLSALAIFVRALPRKIVINNAFFLANNQLIFYSSLVVVYFLHLVNLILLRDKDQVVEEKELSEEELRRIRDEKLDSIIAEIDSKDDSLSDEDRQILNSHILNDGDEQGSEI